MNRRGSSLRILRVATKTVSELRSKVALVCRAGETSNPGTDRIGTADQGSHGERETSPAHEVRTLAPIPWDGNRRDRERT
jgi:hypothetical protein